LPAKRKDASRLLVLNESIAPLKSPCWLHLILSNNAAPTCLNPSQLLRDLFSASRMSSYSSRLCFLRCHRNSGGTVGMFS
jgi:hypothetical protein